MKRNIFRSRLFHVVAVLLFLAVVSLGVAWKSISQADSTGDKNALIITGSSGGMCPDGPCGGDDTIVYADGKLNNHKNISSEDLTRLRNLVNQFDESSYTVGGDCGNSISDGSDRYLKFPQKYGEKEFESCGIPYNANSPRLNPLEDIFQIIDAY